MKIQKNSKLTLRRETLRELAEGDLRRAGGGWECTVTQIGCTLSRLQACAY